MRVLLASPVRCWRMACNTLSALPTTARRTTREGSGGCAPAALMVSSSPARALAFGSDRMNGKLTRWSFAASCSVSIGASSITSVRPHHYCAWVSTSGRISVARKVGSLLHLVWLMFGILFSQPSGRERCRRSFDGRQRLAPAHGVHSMHRSPLARFSVQPATLQIGAGPVLTIHPAVFFNRVE